MCRIPSALHAVALSLLLGSFSVARGEVLAHWSFDQLTGADHDTFEDSSGHFNSENSKMNAIASDKGQIAVNVASDVPFGKAVTFTGKPGSYLNVPYVSGIHEHSFTIAVWVYLTKAEHNYVLADWSGPMNFSYAFGFDVPKGGGAPHISAFMKSDVVKTNKKKEKYNVDVIKFNPTANVTLNAWHHVAWVWDREDNTKGTLTIYLDGAKAESATVAKGSTTSLLNNHRAVRIGLKQDSNSTFNGSMDELWVFNEALAPEQINNLMKTNDINTAPQVVAAATPAGVPTAPVTATPTAATPGSASPAVTAPIVPSAPAIAAAPAAVTPVTPAAPMDDTPAPIAPSTPEPLAAATPAAPAPIAAAPTAAVKPESLQPIVPLASAPYSPVKPTVAVVTSHYTPERLLGLVGSGSLSLVLSGFLVWATKERGRLRNHR
jgi:hypothetical protein